VEHTNDKDCEPSAIASAEDPSSFLRRADEILAHPRFPEARNAMLDAMLGLYEHEPFLNRLLLQVGRNVLFVIIMCLDARADEEDQNTWVTPRLITRSMTEFGLASPRRVADLISRLLKTGYLEQRSSPRDRRIRILRPTEKMIAQDQDWLVSHYVPLQVLYPDPGYGLIMQREPAFQRVQRLVAACLLSHGAQILARNPLMMQFMMREAGMMMLIKLMRVAGANSNVELEISYEDIGSRFGVSRTHVRKLLQEAEKNGLVRLSRGKSLLVQLTPALMEAFDHFIADTMAAHDFIYRLAQRRSKLP
jgi:DNA-binding MarR family transcriptional regulator